MSVAFGPQKSPEDYEYNIKCRVLIVNKTWREESDDFRQHEAKVALLVPELGAAQATAFLNAWLPPQLDEAEKGPRHYEIVMEIGHPVYGPCRGAVMRSSEYCDKPHIFVMSTGAEEVFKALDYKDRESINVTVLAQDKDEVADTAQTINRSAK